MRLHTASERLGGVHSSSFMPCVAAVGPPLLVIETGTKTSVRVDTHRLREGGVDLHPPAYMCGHGLTGSRAHGETMSTRPSRCRKSSRFAVSRRAPWAWAVAAIMRSRLRALALRPARCVAAASSP